MAWRHFILCCAALLLVACSYDHGDLHAYITEVESRGKLRMIEPLPEIGAIPEIERELERNPFVPAQ